MAEEASFAIKAIAGDLAREKAVGPARGGELERLYPHSLGFGKAGIALFFAYLDKCDPQAGASETARHFIEQAVEGVTETRMPPDLYRGFSGIAWAFEHLKETLSEDKALAGGEYEEIDDALKVRHHRRGVESEFLEGLGGVCLFALERLPDSPGAEQLLEHVVAALEEAAEQTPAGTTWRVPTRVATIYENNEFVAEQNVKALFDRGVYKLCVAHGVTGTAAMLAAVYASGVSSSSSAKKLAEGSLSWVLSHRRDEKRVFPQMIGMDLPQVTTGWCNGDLGIGVAIFNAARILERPEWEAIALEVARKEALYRVADIEVENCNNYTLCHGSAGRAHVFNRLFQATGEELFKEAACFWLSHTLKMRVRGQGTGGFLVDEPPLYGGPKNTRGFLMGAAGLGLTLLGAISNVPPAWDRVLLASLPEPRVGGQSLDFGLDEF